MIVQSLGQNWLEAVQAGLRAFQGAYGESLISVYLRGSVARGLAVEGLSDIDLVGYVFEDDMHRTSASCKLAAFLESAKQDYAVTAGFEMRVVTLRHESCTGQAIRAWKAGKGDISLPSTFPGAFLIKAQALQIYGADLAALLPATAAQPAPRVLLSLSTDIRTVLELASRASTLHEKAEAGKAYKWALKRCIRAAFEAAMMENWKGFTRDLFWCCHVAAQRWPVLEPRLVQGLLWVVGPSKDVIDNAQAVEACLLALGSFLATRLRQQELPSSPGKHRPSLPGSEEASRESKGSPLKRFVSKQQLRSRKQLSREARQWLGSRDLELGAIREDLREYKGKVTADVAEFTKNEVLSEQMGWSNTPLVFRGAARHWPAAQKWTLGSLAEHEAFMGLVRVAKSMQFTYVEETHPSIGRGDFAPPTVTVQMSLAEFALRLQTDPPSWLKKQLAPLLAEGERYYMQAALDQHLLSDIDLVGPPFSWQQEQCQVALSQERRLWLSPPGAVSPLHYDASASFLVQVRGCKRMLFYPPSDLLKLYPYPDYHPLRRRAQVDPTAPDLQKYSLFAGAQALQVLLEPGDVLFFPGLWSHYTESLDLSMSVTCRFSSSPVIERPSLLGLDDGSLH